MRDQRMKLIRYIKYAVAAPLLKPLIGLIPSIARRAEPPALINFAGGGDFKRIGDRHVDWLIEFAGLRGGDRVLEIGCGIGRNATALHRRFGEDIHYLGFDVVGYGIEWCRRHFDWLKSSYQFLHTDIRNSFYNPRGKLPAAHYRFPCADADRNIVLATSVFTHMQPGEVRHYAAEASRVLRPAGYFCFTAFVVDEASREEIARGTADRQFERVAEGAWIESSTEPDLAVAYERMELTAILQAVNLSIEAIKPGVWRGVAAADHQDVVIARKNA